MKTININRFYEKKVILKGFILGLIGGLLMIWLTSVDFGLGYIAGYLPLINYFLIMTVGLKIYKTLVKESSTYFKRFGFAFFIYLIITVVYILYKTISNTFTGTNNTLLEDFLIILITFAIGLFISALLALFIKTRLK
jgi:hypothetical protein